ncbi:MAG: hypothetical protein DMG06_01175 [Acidobacteria bacterium]|nr:MAG: hypothetical protein DMG06_01175 [Acidobacteriota bacterium]
MEIRRRQFVQASAAALGGLLFAGQLRVEAEKEADIHVCPKSQPPARLLFATRLEELTTYSADLRLTLTCLQGIVNRSQPRLYLVQDRYDELWLQWLRERGDVDEVRWLDVGQVFERFLKEVRSMIVTDPAIPASINVATMLAGVHGGLVSTPRTAAQYDLPMGAMPDSQKVGLDLRTLGWKKDLDAYRWVYQQVEGKLSRQAIAILDPQEVALRDYLVEFKIPILWIAGPQDVEKNARALPEEEKQFAREILMKWPPNIPCLGWPGSGDQPQSGIGEWAGVRLANECAKFEVCSGFDGYSPTVSNLSVHSGTTATLRQSVPPVKLQRDKIYFCFTRSDGDGWNFQRHYYRKLFYDPQHGTIPIGWQIGPTAFDGQPDLLDYYYKHARPGDCFINALTGVGYIQEENYADNFPPEERDKIWRDYLKLSEIYRGRIDATVMSTIAEMRPELLTLFAGIAGLKGIFANYGRTHVTTPDNLVAEVNGVPAFRAINRGPSHLTFTPSARRDAEYFMIGEIKRWTPRERPAFLHVFLANWLTHLEMAENIVKGLGAEYIAVRPDQLVGLYRQHKAG